MTPFFKLILIRFLRAQADPFVGCNKGGLTVMHAAARDPQKSFFLPLFIAQFPDLAEAKTQWVCVLIGFRFFR